MKGIGVSGYFLLQLLLFPCFASLCNKRNSMLSNTDMQWVMLLERGGRKLVSNHKTEYFMFHLLKDDMIVGLGYSRESVHDALLRCVKMYVKEHPHGELATKLERHQQRANLKAVKEIINAAG